MFPDRGTKCLNHGMPNACDRLKKQIDYSDKHKPRCDDFLKETYCLSGQVLRTKRINCGDPERASCSTSAPVRVPETDKKPKDKRLLLTLVCPSIVLGVCLMIAFWICAKCKNRDNNIPQLVTIEDYLRHQGTSFFVSILCFLSSCVINVTFFFVDLQHWDTFQYCEGREEIGEG